MKNALAIVLLLLSATSAAQLPPSAVTREVEFLFDTLAASGCDFSRNGKWHDGRQAADHLRRKYDYLVNKGSVTNAESFVELAATRSSISGRPYQVKCGAAPEEDSRSWLMDRLTRLRNTASSANPRSR